MSRVELKLAALAAIATLCVLSFLRPAMALFESLPLLRGAISTAAPYQLEVSAYPSALPNDGRAEAELTVRVEQNGAPACGLSVAGAVTDGGGSLRDSTSVTDSEGVAHFAYRAGMMPFEGKVNFTVKPADGVPTAVLDQVQLTIPIAPVSYLDVQLVTPEEYERLKNLRKAAAAVYTLSLSCFPQQLAADGGSMATVCCELKNMLGKPAAGVALTAKLASGDGTILQADKVTDGSGKLYLDFIAGLMPGTASIRVTEPSSGLSQTIDITLVKAGPARIKLRYGGEGAPVADRQGTYLPSDSVSELPLVAEVTDLNGVPLSGIELKLEVLELPANGWLETPDCVSDGRGLVRFTYHAGSQPGRVRLRAYAARGLEKLPGWQN